MSTMAYTASDDPAGTQPKTMPREVGNLAAAWWLTIVFSLLLLLGVLPMAPRPLVVAETISQTGWLSFMALGLILLGFGIYVGVGLRTGKPGTLKLCKIGLIALLVLDLVAFAGVLALAAGSKPDAGATAASDLLGPRDKVSIVPTISLLAMVVLLPVVFAVLGFSLAASYEVTEYFAPPQVEAVSYTAEESAGGVWEAAGAATATLQPDRVDTGTVPLGAPGGGLEAPLDVSSEAFDAALAEEMPGGTPGEIQAEMPEAVAESAPDIDFTSHLPEAEPEASGAEAPAKPADQAPQAGRGGSTPDMMDVVLADPSVGITDSFIVKGPPKMTLSQMDISDEEPPEEGTAIEPAKTWDINQEKPNDKDKPHKS